ncbi:MAG: glutathione peroxidase [Verrucomicrobiota bacterium]
MSVRSLQAFIAISALFLVNTVPANQPEPVQSIYDQALTDIDGAPTNLRPHRGKVLLIVNTASQCGATPQYNSLVALQNIYGDKDFTVLAFPANNFGGQEPGSNEEIKVFCDTEYNVNFPLFAKVSVAGDDKHPLFTQLAGAENQDFTGDIQWNFEKILVGKDGRVLRRFRTHTEPDDPKLTNAIEAALDATAPGAPDGGCDDC